MKFEEINFFFNTAEQLLTNFPKNGNFFEKNISQAHIISHLEEIRIGIYTSQFGDSFIERLKCLEKSFLNVSNFHNISFKQSNNISTNKLKKDEFLTNNKDIYINNELYRNENIDNQNVHLQAGFKPITPNGDIELDIINKEYNDDNFVNKSRNLNSSRINDIDFSKNSNKSKNLNISRSDNLSKNLDTTKEEILSRNFNESINDNLYQNLEKNKQSGENSLENEKSEYINKKDESSLHEKNEVFTKTNKITEKYSKKNLSSNNLENIFNKLFKQNLKQKEKLIKKLKYTENISSQNKKIQKNNTNQTQTQNNETITQQQNTAITNNIHNLQDYMLDIASMMKKSVLNSTKIITSDIQTLQNLTNMQDQLLNQSETQANKTKKIIKNTTLSFFTTILLFIIGIFFFIIMLIFIVFIPF